MCYSLTEGGRWLQVRGQPPLPTQTSQRSTTTPPPPTGQRSSTSPRKGQRSTTSHLDRSEGNHRPPPPTHTHTVQRSPPPDRSGVNHLPLFSWDRSEVNHLPVLRSMGGRYASYCNAILLLWYLCAWQVRSLTEPYGICEEINPVPVSECHLNCKTEKVIDACACHDVYMRPSHHGNGKYNICQEK